MMDEKLKGALDRARNKKKDYADFLKRLKKKPPKNLDQQAQQITEEVFEEVDCLKCANCCSTTSPIFRTVDIDRICKHLKVNPGKFIEENLHIDEDGDYVLNSSPCLFLGSDNYCSIYSVRPNACREYPHTDRKNFHQITSLTQRNTQMCPAAAMVVERMMKQVV